MLTLFDALLILVAGVTVFAYLVYTQGGSLGIAGYNLDRKESRVMWTFFCIECLLVMKQRGMEGATSEKHVASICDSCSVLGDEHLEELRHAQAQFIS